MMRARIYLNGRFLTQPMTGAQRFAHCIVRAMDETLSSRAEVDRPHVTLLAPRASADMPGLRAIQVRRIGPLSGHAWDQITLASAAGDGALISLCAAGPVLHPRHVVQVYDAAVYQIPETFGRTYRIVHRALDRGYARFSQMATLSQFSRAELEALLKPRRPLLITPPAAEHLLDIVADATILNRLNLTNTPFFLCLGSIKKNKNLGTAVAALGQGPASARLVIVGDRNEKVFGLEGAEESEHVTWAGRCSDEEVVALMHAARAFVFPSTYEGFGIPPLEAMALGCPVLASTAPAVVETCGAGARYFDPHDSAALAALMHEVIEEPQPCRAAWINKARAQAATYSWRRSAALLLSAAEALARDASTAVPHARH